MPAGDFNELERSSKGLLLGSFYQADPHIFSGIDLFIIGIDPAVRNAEHKSSSAHAPDVNLIAYQLGVRSNFA